MPSFALALRVLLKRPLFTAVAVLTLALGIGANTAMFSVVNAVLLRPAPFEAPERLVVVWASNPELAQKSGFPDKLPCSPAIFYDWQAESSTLSRMAMIRPNPVSLSGDGDPELLGAVHVTGEFFRLLGVHAAVGRTLLPEDDAVDAPRTVVFSHGLWQRRYGGDPGVVGRSVQINRASATVVGVMPRGFAFPRGAEMPSGYGFAADPDVWVPLALAPERRRNRGNRGSLAIARLADGVRRSEAQAELETITARMQQAYPETDKTWGVRIDPLPEQLTGDVKPGLVLLLGAVGLVLLIACGNVASLMLAQALARRREVAIRVALGAGRGRLAGQFLAESLLLALAGGGLGLFATFASLRTLEALIPATVPGASHLSLDLRVLAFTALVSVTTGLVFGLAPALQASGADPGEALKEGARAAGAARSRRTLGALVAAQVALTIVPLLGAGLLLKSFARLMDRDPGFRRQGLLTFYLELSGSKYDRDATRSFTASLVERLRALPGVAAAGATTALPMSGSENLEQIEVFGQPKPEPGKEIYVDDRAVTPGLFAALGIPLKRGRVLLDTDGAEQQKVAVVSESLARAHWPGEDPIGRRLTLNLDEPDWRTVVGVVGDVRHSGLHGDARGTVYRPLAQSPRGDLFFAVRTLGEAGALTAPVRAAVRALDPDQPVDRVRTMEQVIADSVSGRRFNLVLLALFAGLALALSAIGVYGLTSYAVGQRLREIGLRLALGATPADVLRLVLRQALTVTVLGAGLGLLAGLALARLMSSLLFDVGATDPPTFAAAAGFLLLVALLASVMPGLRATRVDPANALREE
jgi:putative ABC transport system permease protein